jgi:hypothetical protein
MIKRNTLISSTSARIKYKNNTYDAWNRFILKLNKTKSTEIIIILPLCYCKEKKEFNQMNQSLSLSIQLNDHKILLYYN